MQVEPVGRSHTVTLGESVAITVTRSAMRRPVDGAVSVSQRFPDHG